MSSAAAPVALITGATGGIGSAVARRLHREGMRVVVSSSSSVTQGQRLADELVPAAYIRADLTDPVQARHLVDETIKHFGQLDLLVNNAAAFAQIPHEDLEAVTPEMWRRLFDVNVIAPGARSRLRSRRWQRRTDTSSTSLPLPRCVPWVRRYPMRSAKQRSVT